MVFSNKTFIILLKITVLMSFEIIEHNIIIETDDLIIPVDSHLVLCAETFTDTIIFKDIKGTEHKTAYDASLVSALSALGFAQISKNLYINTFHLIEYNFSNNILMLSQNISYRVQKEFKRNLQKILTKQVNQSQPKT